MTPTATTHADFSFASLFWQADIFVQLIMLLLAGMSVLVWAVWLFKWRQFDRVSKQANDFEEAFWRGDKTVKELYKKTKPEEAEHPFVKVYLVGQQEWERSHAEGKGEMTRFTALNRTRRLMDATMTRELEEVETWLPYLASVGSAAPFIGLLGTVWGIMNSFQSIGAMKSTSLAVVAPGIAEALLATALGLFAAIPAVLAYNRLSSHLGRYATRLEAFVNELLSLFEREQEEVEAGKAKGKKTV